MLQLSPQVEKELTALAATRGLSLSDYLAEMAARELQGRAAELAMTGEERAQAFLEWADSFPDIRVLSDDSISRTGMYPDRW